MTRIIALLLITFPTFCFAQFAGVNLAYSCYKGDQDDVFDGHGFHLGVSYEHIFLGVSEFFLSPYFHTSYYLPQREVLQEDIAFELPENQIEYGNAKLRKSNLAITLGSDLGYWTGISGVFQPFVTLGATMYFKNAKLDYDLYNPVDCDCLSDGVHEIQSTMGLGFVTGGGIKLLAIEDWLLFDFRFAITGTWLLEKKSTQYADISTFYIDEYGEYQLDYYDKRFFWSFRPSVGVTFNLPVNTISSSYNDEDDDWETDGAIDDENEYDWNETETYESEETTAPEQTESNENSEEKCEEIYELKPKGKRKKEKGGG